MARVTKPVFVVGTGQTFPSASAAAKALGINPGNLYSVLAGRRKTAGGYQFGYTANRAVSVSKNGETKIYSTLEAAAKAVHANPNKIDSIVSGRVKKTVKGYEATRIVAQLENHSIPTKNIKIDIENTPNGDIVFLNGKDVTKEIRSKVMRVFITNLEREVGTIKKKNLGTRKSVSRFSTGIYYTI